MQCHDKNCNTATNPKQYFSTHDYEHYAQKFLEITTRMSDLRFLG